VSCALETKLAKLESLQAEDADKRAEQRAELAELRVELRAALADRGRGPTIDMPAMPLRSVN